MKIASIDIGSNTILMQILDNNEIIADFCKIARLSEGINETEIINETAILRAETILREYNAMCARYNIEKIIAVGTSALREARNSKKVVNRLENCLHNSSIEIITGEKEAEYSFIGSVSGKVQNKDYVVIDIGGGSTEIISGNIDKINYKISVPIGVVKLTEHFLISQPLDNINKIKDYVEKQFNIVDFSKCIGEVIAVSGTPTAMASIALGINEYDSNKINNYVFSKTELNDVSTLIYSKTIDELVNKYNIERGRADVLSAGAIILCEIVNMLSKKRKECLAFTVNVNGLRYGVAINYLRKINNWNINNI
jgi:exopolyphosphatase/guanosine-5'-triphosphate,3'-diphosphate pyrophosphatase